MKANKDQTGKVSTCFEGSPCAEMMQRIMGEEGIGSLCAEMMRSLVKKSDRGRGETDKGSETSPGKDKDQGIGGRK